MIQVNVGLFQRRQAWRATIPASPGRRRGVAECAKSQTTLPLAMSRGLRLSLLIMSLSLNSELL
jgi:hypothetical protein